MSLQCMGLHSCDCVKARWAVRRIDAVRGIVVEYLCDRCLAELRASHEKVATVREIVR